MRLVLGLGLVMTGAGLAAAAPYAGGDPVRGKISYQKCYACHALEPGRNDLSGPSLHGIVGRPIAAEKGFAYSPALKAFARIRPRWTPELLDRFVADPEQLVPGTDMLAPGVRNPAERADLIAFLAKN